jgi:Leucine-rich repeat (LRR) protein
MSKRRFRLAILFVAVAAVLAGWLTTIINDGKKQRGAVKALESNQAIVQLDSKPDAPEWLKKAIGPQYFRGQNFVDFATHQGRKEGSDELKANDEALKSLSSLTGVEVVELGNQVELKDSDLERLTPLKNLKTLYLYRTGIKGPGLVHLQELRKLQSISLDRCDIDDSGAKYLGNLPNLTWLRLENTKVTDAGMADLARITELKMLCLDNTDITDIGLTQLEQLSNLKELIVTGTHVTAEGIARFREKLPNCTVSATFGLGVMPQDELLFAAGSKPTATEINAKLKELAIDGEVETDANRPGNPIVSLRLFGCFLSDRVVLALMEQMPDLETLNLRRALVGDDVIQGIDKWGIKYLLLDETRITDHGLSQLSRCESLRELYLTGTAITDAGLPDLERLTQVKMIMVRRTRITMRGIEQLRNSLPGCQISE